MLAFFEEREQARQDAELIAAEEAERRQAVEQQREQARELARTVNRR